MHISTTIHTENNLHPEDAHAQEISALAGFMSCHSGYTSFHRRIWGLSLPDRGVSPPNMPRIQELSSVDMRAIIKYASYHWWISAL